MSFNTVIDSSGSGLSLICCCWTQKPAKCLFYFCLFSSLYAFLFFLHFPNWSRQRATSLGLALLEVSSCERKLFSPQSCCACSEGLVDFLCVILGM